MLRRALCELAARGVRLHRVSSVYDTDPVGFQDQEQFLNLVIEGSWEGTASELIQGCMDCERALGRARLFRDAPRSIDVDILLIGDQVVKTEKLVVPHPRMHLRKFVLVPLSELAPAVIHPVIRLSVLELLARCDDVSGVRKVLDPFTVEPPDPTRYNPAASRGKDE